MTETTQTVATETNGAAPPAPAASGGAPGDDLDALLKQFEAPTETKPNPEAKPEPAKPDASADYRELANYVRTERDNKARASTRADLDKAVSAVKAEIDDAGHKLPDRLVRGALRDFAEEDPRFLQAWVKRGENPKAWEGLLKAAAKEIRKDFENSPDPQATEDKAAVRAAVRSASTASPQADAFDEKAWVRMSPGERKQALRRMGT